MNRQALAYLVSSLTAAGLLLTACSSTEGEVERREALAAASRSLLPESAEVIGAEAAQCREVALRPSCYHLYFSLTSRSFAEREALIRAAAREAGWATGPELRGPGGIDMRFRRGEFEAAVHLWPEPADSCDEPTLRECSTHIDNLLVQRT